MKATKKKITIFLSSATFESLEKLAEFNEQSRSTTAAAIIKKATEKYRPNVEA